MTDAITTAGKRARWYSPRSIGRSLILRPRVVAAAIIGVVAILLLPSSLHPAVREAIAWCLSGITYLALSFRLMSQCHSDTIRTRAARQDDSGVVILVLVLLAIVSSFTAIFGLLAVAKGATNEGKLFIAGLTATTIVISWLVTQVTFTFHYAHEYYSPRQFPKKGEKPIYPLAFPNDTTPDYWDFFYFSTSFGAASQTSDVSINSKEIRRLTILHAVVSFFFNTMVLALTINLAASMV
ncbi:DUF1345 domain-containing protein [Hyphomicrobium sp.]|uniref:DUF1345 domain-containing protein n=1 Tax=Hyphomicrobium sp. TaxID=82 RepID=UPI002D798EB8|nr:DUF1345 domain-containing protein [Hyphomicrobium sp.]HET6389006.1 DUF1345 domain-containing protein [Hyphomicrobium sp.]